MALTYAEKEQYVKAIDAIWQGSMRNNNVDNISDDVVSLVDTVLTEIRSGSEGLALVHLAFSIFYIHTNPWKVTLVMAIATGDVSDWIGVMRGNRQYAAVLNVAALNFKSAVQLALYGL